MNVPKEEQKKWFLERVEEPDKNWKFLAADIYERSRFDEYMEAYEDILNYTSMVNAPLYSIP
ncbi:MAG: polyphosphate kinase 2 family protein, partial [Methanomicrobiales archaeon]